MSDDAIRRIVDRYVENTGKRIDFSIENSKGDFVVPEPKGVAVDTLDEEEDNKDMDPMAGLRPDDENMQEEISKVKKMLRPEEVADEDKPRINI